jgi:hypothetical protein
LGEERKGISKVRGKGTKLREGCPKVRLSQDRMAIDPLTLSPLPQLEPFGITGFLIYVFGIFTTLGNVTYGTIT